MAKAQNSISSVFSLLKPEATGGIHGGEGYTYQDRYIVCHIAKWFSDPAFVRLMPEGTGDVDVVYQTLAGEVYEHIQVKDHNVTKAEFRSVIENFVRIDSGTAHVYRKFTLSAPSIANIIEPLSFALNRYRKGSEFFAEPDQHALNTTRSDLEERISSLGLGVYSNFIIDKLIIEVGVSYFGDNSACKQVFVSTLMESPKYQEYLFSLISPAYSAMIEQVLAHKGKVLERGRIEELIDASLIKPGANASDHVLHVHNWTFEQYTPEATVVLDWSHLFDRSTRKVPEEHEWNDQLFPELYKLRQDLAKSSTNRHIVFRGKCALTTGIVLGAAFPEIGNWSFELQQPSASGPWRSDAEKIKEYRVRHREIAPSSLDLKEGSELVVVFNITGQALEDVIDYLHSAVFCAASIVVIEPNGPLTGFSIANDSEAVTLAQQAKEIIKGTMGKYRCRKAHLFYFGPISLALFLGQKLTSVGQIQLYEFQDPGYKPSCLIKT